MSFRRTLLTLLLAIAVTAPLGAQAATATEGDQGSGYFRDQDTLPGSYKLYQQWPEVGGNWWGLGPGEGRLPRSRFKADAHEGVANYTFNRRCIECHREHDRDLHMSRVNLTCVQCHRDQPIAGVFQYYSPMNPIRRHAYVCAKCHEGASQSFASYVVHEPPMLTLRAIEEFPLLGYAVWFMAILAGGVFVFFLPFTGLWWLREVLGKLFGRAKSKGDANG